MKTEDIGGGGLRPHLLFVDFETRSTVDIAKCGSFKYIADPSFDVLLLAYAWDDEPVKLVDCLDEEEFYSGVKGAASLRFYPYNNAGNTGISCNLDNLLKLEDGDRIGGGSMSADQAFADLV